VKKTWYKRKEVVVLLHASVWILLFMLPFILQQYLGGHHNKGNAEDSRLFMYLTIFNDLIYVSLFYFNAIVLVPRFINKRKYLGYLISQVVVISAFWLLQRFFFDFIIHLPFHFIAFVFYNLFPYLFIIACSTAYRMIQDRVELETRNQEMENENLKTELSFLRSQVNPHFMFNVLNNMVALARKKSDLLEPSLIKLSSLLRYMLYETDEQKVPLEKEVEYLKSYIDLQMQRFGNKLAINLNITSPDNAYEIEPMLLIPFVENAFKHGTGMISEPEINIDLKAQKNKLTFVISNKYNGAIEEEKDSTSGIGLNNVKRRLNLLYGKKQQLQITDTNHWFTVSLQLTFH
jgi:two-component system, LytTR family, sensor kinase